MNTPRPNWSFNTPNSRFRFCAPAAITTTSLAETLTIARFMLCDRDADAFSRPPTEEAFQAYVREHCWDERAGRGGWECANLFCCVRRNAVYGEAYLELGNRSQRRLALPAVACAPAVEDCGAA